MNRMNVAKGLILGLCVFFVSTPLFAEAGRIAEINDIQGDVQFRKSGTTEWKGAEKGMLLLEGDAIKTGAESKATLVLDKAGETGQLDLAPSSQLRIQALKKDAVTEDKTTLLDLAVGKVLVKAEKLKGNSTFQVKTPTSICGVRGTSFEVSVD